MGNLRSKERVHNVLLLGLEDCGKSELLSEEELSSEGPGHRRFEKLFQRVKYTLWDMRENEVFRVLWPSFYRSIEFAFIVFVVDACAEERFSEVARNIALLTNEEELRNSFFLLVFLGKQGGDVKEEWWMNLCMESEGFHKDLHFKCLHINEKNTNLDGVLSEMSKLN